MQKRPDKTSSIAAAIAVVMFVVLSLPVAAHAQEPFVYLGACLPRAEVITVTEESDGDQEFYAEIASEPDIRTSLFWTVTSSDGLTRFVHDEDGTLHTGTFAHLYGLIDGTVSARAVPEPAGTESDILAYGEENPRSVHTWQIRLVSDPDAPAVEPAPESGLHLMKIDGFRYVLGLSAADYARNVPALVQSLFVYFEDTAPVFLREGIVLGPNEQIGTGTVYELTLDGPHGILVVAGDLTGDGTATLADLVRIAQAFTGARVLSMAERLAAAGSNRAITLTDLVREADLVRNLAQ